MRTMVSMASPSSRRYAMMRTSAASLRRVRRARIRRARASARRGRILPRGDERPAGRSPVEGHERAFTPGAVEEREREVGLERAEDARRPARARRRRRRSARRRAEGPRRGSGSRARRAARPRAPCPCQRTAAACTTGTPRDRAGVGDEELGREVVAPSTTTSARCTSCIALCGSDARSRDRQLARGRERLERARGRLRLGSAPTSASSKRICRCRLRLLDHVVVRESRASRRPRAPARAPPGTRARRRRRRARAPARAGAHAPSPGRTRARLKYRSPVSGSTVTTFLPGPSVARDLERDEDRRAGAHADEEPLPLRERFLRAPTRPRP